MITLNLGILFILKELNPEFFLVLFASQWFLFANLRNVIKGDSTIYTIYTYIFLLLTAIIYFVILKFNEGVLHASFFMVILALIVYGFYNLYNREINYIDIPKIVEGCLSKMVLSHEVEIDSLIEIDKEARQLAAHIN
jgi:hypothetical protein